MTDEALKRKLLEINGEEIEKHGAAIAAFCIANNIPLEKGVDFAIDCLGDILKQLIASGAIERGERYCKRIKEEFADLNAKLAAEMEGEYEKDKGDSDIHDAE